MNLEKTVKEKLLTLGACLQDPFLVAVSGGADSTALLLTMKAVPVENGCLAVAHLDHGVRPGSEKDLERVLELCRTLGVAAVTGKLQTSEIEVQRRLHGSLEAAMRILRYRFLHEAALKMGSKWILTGHTFDDQVETVLFRIARGMDWRSLDGIPERRGSVLRPLLQVRRSSTWDYCRDRNIDPVIDPTNYDETFARGRIRNRSLPGLESGFNSDIYGLLNRMGQAAGRLSVAEEKLLERITPDSGRLYTHTVKRELVLDLPEVLQMRVIQDYLRGILAGFPSRNLAKNVLEFIRAGENGEITLPGNRIIRISYGSMRVAEKNPGIRDNLPSISQELKVPGIVVLTLAGISVTADESTLETPGVYPYGNTALISRKCFTGSLWVRKRQPGDRFWPIGMENEKKLKEFFIDRKVPRDVRDRIPVVLNSRGEILWVGGIEISQKAALTGYEGEEAVQLRIESLTADDLHTGGDGVVH